MRHERDVVNTYLSSSRDGIDWDLSWIYANEPFLPRGPSGSFYTCAYIGHRRRHVYGTGYRRAGTRKRPATADELSPAVP